MDPDTLAASRLDRLGTFLHLLATGMFVGTITELLAAKHYDELLQFVPFLLCVLGLLSLAVVWRHTSRRVIGAHRALMIVIALGSLLGVYEHVMANMDFIRETRPGASTKTLLISTFTGRDPLLAPGILALGAALAIASTYARGLWIADPETRTDMSDHPARRPMDRLMRFRPQQ